jgi:hypothetical protein
MSDPRAQATPDVRAKLTVKQGAGGLEDVFPGAMAGPMKFLERDRGIVFPYVPTIMMQHQASYGTHQPIHSNFVYKYFQNYSLQEFTITAPFTSHTTSEGRYMEGALHFLKSSMKIGFGEFDDQRGVPPPVLEFSAWGEAWAKRIPVVITNFSYNIDGAVDYTWPTSGVPTAKDSMMPLKVDVIINLAPTYSTKSTRVAYTSERFYNGSLLHRGYV